jgi:hypothetical protein
MANKHLIVGFLAIMFALVVIFAISRHGSPKKQYKGATGIEKKNLDLTDDRLNMTNYYYDDDVNDDDYIDYYDFLDGNIYGDGERDGNIYDNNDDEDDDKDGDGDDTKDRQDQADKAAGLKQGDEKKVKKGKDDDDGDNSSSEESKA